VAPVETRRQGRRPALSRASFVLAAAAVSCAFAWSYSGVLTDLWNIWQRNDNYSSGVLVPFLAAYLVLARRKQLAQLEHRPSFLGLSVILGAFVLRFLGSALMLGSVERFSTVVAIVGIVLFLFGVQVTRRLGWVLAFLLLMLPWPNRVYTAASLPLQSLATKSTVFVLETLGYFATHEGNIIHVEDTTVAVAEACSGLHMLTAFLIVAALVAFLCRRGVGQKMLLVASSVPIAILCNTIRLTATAIAFTAGYHEQVNQFFHDFGGVAMMPLALALLAGELWVMKLLFVRGGVATPSAAGTN
jgi:exosortase